MTSIPESTFRNALQKPLERTDFPRLGKKYEGKVRDNYTPRTAGASSSSTDRISAFDRVLGTLPLKGQVLNPLAAWWFEKTERRRAEPRARGARSERARSAASARRSRSRWSCARTSRASTSTSIWTHYQKGERVVLRPPAARRPEEAPAPPERRSSRRAPRPPHGDHDVSASREEILAHGRCPRARLRRRRRAWRMRAVRATASACAPSAGSSWSTPSTSSARRRTASIVVIDEIHTPDSSRFWFAEHATRSASRRARTRSASTRSTCAAGSPTRASRATARSRPSPTRCASRPRAATSRPSSASRARHSAPTWRTPSDALKRTWSPSSASRPRRPNQEHSSHVAKQRLHRRRRPHPDRRVPRRALLGPRAQARRGRHQGRARAREVAPELGRRGLHGQRALGAASARRPRARPRIFAGLPDTVPCHDGEQGLRLGPAGGHPRRARRSPLGEHEIVVAGGMESMSNVPYYLEKARSGYRMGNGKIVDGMIHDGLWDPYNERPHGHCGELVRQGVQVLARGAGRVREGELPPRARRAEGGPVRGRDRAGERRRRRRATRSSSKHDEEPGQAATRREVRARSSPRSRRTAPSPPATPRRSTTAPSALVLASEAAVKKHGLEAARAASSATAAPRRRPSGSPPRPRRRSRTTLAKLGLKTRRIDLWEINEAFAVVAMAVQPARRPRPGEGQRPRRRGRPRSPDRRERRAHPHHAARTRMQGSATPSAASRRSASAAARRSRSSSSASSAGRRPRPSPSR